MHGSYRTVHIFIGFCKQHFFCSVLFQFQISFRYFRSDLVQTCHFSERNNWIYLFSSRSKKSGFIQKLFFFEISVINLSVQFIFSMCKTWYNYYAYFTKIIWLHTYATQIGYGTIFLRKLKFLLNDIMIISNKRP